jgi:7-keto-8-aminopelargonate synthetase-like enzyme
MQKMKALVKAKPEKGLWAARIRVQLSAAQKTEHLDKAIAAFEKVGKELGTII